MKEIKQLKETKICSKCQSVIDEKAEKCPHCQADQNNQLRTNSTFTTCPICNSKNTLIAKVISRLGGLLKTTTVTCSSCSSVFEQRKNGFKLTYIPDTKITLMGMYVEETLTPTEWERVYIKQQDMQDFTKHLQKGMLPPIRQSTENNYLLLQKDEQNIITIPGILLCEPKTIRTGVSRGMTVRVAKGVYYRTGAGRSQSHEEVKPADMGTLTLTNKRLSFNGGVKSIIVELRKITAIQEYIDPDRPQVAAIALNSTNRQKPLYFEGLEQATLTININGRTYQEKLSGNIMASMIEGLIGKIAV